MTPLNHDFSPRSHLIRAAACLLLLPIAASLLGCAGGGPTPVDVATSTSQQRPDAIAAVGTLEFVESLPAETDLDLPELAEAARRWPEVLAGARQTVDIASFYYSRQGDGQDAAAPPDTPDPLLPVLGAVTDAAARGCRVRILGDSKFNKTYPEVLDELSGRTNITVGILPADRLWDGVMHAKYFLVDDDLFYIGSQNWDWRALSQIRELGALVRHPHLAADLQRIFELDWRLAAADAAGEPETTIAAEVPPDGDLPVPRSSGLTDLPRARVVTAGGDTVTAILAASPVQALPEGVPWDLPLLVEMIDGARESIRIQLLSYNVSDRAGRFFADLDNALRRAAARNVPVQVVLSNWAKVGYKLHWIQSLAAVANIEVKFSNIPDYSGGFIPYARVEHAKYMVVDGEKAWLGTSNWSRSYFYSSRNVSLLLDGPGAAAPLEAYFARTWTSDYTEIVDPGADYQPPRRN